jgi:hypothetical protein
MNEGMSRGPSPEEQKRQQEKEDAEQLAAHFALHPEQLNSPPATSGEDGPEITEFEAMLALFESTHSLVELNSIVELSPDIATVFEFEKEMSYTAEQLDDSLRDITLVEPAYAKRQRERIAAAKTIVLSPEDAKKYEIRIAAKKDIFPMAEKLGKLKGNARYEDLKLEYLRLARAVGMKHKYKINHDNVK